MLEQPRLMIGSVLSKYKILPPLLGFIAGIIIGDRAGYDRALVVIITLAIGALYFYRPKLTFLIFVLLGILFSVKSPPPDNHVFYLTETELNLEGVLFKSPEHRERGTRLFVDATNVFIGGKGKEVTGKVMITTDEAVTGLRYGDRVRLIKTKLRPIKSFHNPGSFDAKSYYERQGIYVTGFVSGKDWIISFGKDESSNSFIHYVDKLRVRFGGFIREKSPYPESEIIGAITIGWQSGIPADLMNRFSRTGIIHVLSISGLHVGVVAVFFFFLIKWLLKRSEYILLRFQVPRLTAALTILPLFVYTVIAGFATPAVRAFIMASVYLISIAVGREDNKLNTLGVAAFITLLWHPWSIFELSFQLSFISVLAILLVNKFHPFKLQTTRDKLLSSVKATLAASFATLPFIINSFGVLSVISVPANIIFVPLVEFISVPLGLLTFAVFFISKTIAAVLLLVNVYLVKLLIWGTGLILKIPFSYLTVPSLGSLSWMLYGLLLIPILLWRSHPKLRLALPVLIVAFLASSAYAIYSNADRSALRVDFLDAGDRNVIFVQFPQDKTLLFDGGFSYYDRGGFIERSVISPFLLKTGVTKIDYLILASLDNDHLTGAKELLQKFRVDNLWTNGGKLDGGMWELIRDKNINWKNISTAETIYAGGVLTEFFRPQGDFEIKDSRRPGPLVGKLTLKETGVLFGEEITQEVQSGFMNASADKIKSSVIYLPSAGASFISAVSPKVIVTNTPISATGTDTEDKKKKVPDAFSTTAHGTVSVLLDGSRIRVETYLDDGEYNY